MRDKHHLVYPCLSFFLLAACSSLPTVTPVGGAETKPMDSSPIPTNAVNPTSIGPTDTPVSAEIACSLGKDWHLYFTVSGGFAGVMRALTLHDTGPGKAVDQKNGLMADLVLSPDEQNGILVEMAKACPFEPVEKSRKCADCFTYTLNLQTGGRTASVELNDLELAGSRYQGLVRALMKYLSSALAGTAAPSPTK